MNHKRICLWSSPRNISTAMMYSFAQRKDTTVFDEPLYAHYLSVTGIEHPGRDQVLASQENDGEKVVSDVILGDHGKEILFFKQMTHHLVTINEDFLTQVSNILFIRDPKQIIASYSQVRSNPTMNDIGIEKQFSLYNDLIANNIEPIVLDSNEILKAPGKVMRTLCEVLNISFDTHMLHWTPGARKEDGVWAKYWYDNVHRSSGFEKQKTSDRTLPEHLEPLYNESKKYYDELFLHSIKA